MPRPHIVAFLLPCILFTSASAQTPQQPDYTRKYWVFFKDKGTQIGDREVWRRVAETISDRAKQRRVKNLGSSPIIREEDLPLFSHYIEEITQRGGIFRQQSRWLNAGSFSLTPFQKRSVENLSFVKEIRPVLTFYRDQEIVEADVQSMRSADTLDYGPSFAQVDMINAVKVHQLGVTGEGVIVGMLDTGFRWRIHEALQNAQVLAERDFIQNDDTTANQAGDAPTQDQHGTLTMSVLGGSMPAKLIGPAFGVQFLLAKTEYVPTETQIEEDHWVAGIEWMEALGADVVSSSLGYNIFDDGAGYRWENGDFNGRTAVTSRAAIQAARLGVVVCTAMGNEGNGNGVRGTMLAPADADSILSVGAVTFSRTLAGFSSTGPTNDGRTKPEVVAPGSGVYGALPGPSSYGFSSGTSLSTPLTAASAALLLSARPELTVMQVRDAIRYSADSVHSSQFPARPNNFTGLGLVNVRDAISYPSLDFVSSANRIAAFVGAMNGIYADSVQLVFIADTSAPQLIPMTRIGGPGGRSNGTYQAEISNLSPGTFVRFHLDATDSLGNQIRIPRDSAKRFSFVFGSQILNPPDTASGPPLPRTFALNQNYPNPFNGTTTIRFDSPVAQEGTMAVYNLLGQEIKVFPDRSFHAGSNFFIWDGTTEAGNSVASGMYLYALRTPTFSEVKKLILLR